MRITKKNGWINFIKNVVGWTMNTDYFEFHQFYLGMFGYVALYTVIYPHTKIEFVYSKKEHNKMNVEKILCCLQLNI